jgi:SSS family solute:Na+ symporter
MWIPHFFYWGFNQFITQRTLGAQSLKHGQNGIILAAFIKLIIPFIIVFPGIMAFQLFGDKIGNGDQAYAVLIRELLPSGLRGIMFAALFGAVMSSLDSMLNSASTIFTMDIYKKYFNKDAASNKTVKIGRIATAVFVIIGCFVAPLPAQFSGVFKYIQMIWGFISPGIVAVFVFGLLFRKAPQSAAVTAMLAGIPIYGLLLWFLPEVAFLNHMGVTFLLLIFIMTMITILKPLPEKVIFEKNTAKPESSQIAKWGGMVVIVLTLILYIIFW